MAQKPTNRRRTIEDEGISGSCTANEIVHGPQLKLINFASVGEHAVAITAREGKPHDVILGWPVFGVHVLLLVCHHKDVLFTIVEVVYDRNRLKSENAVKSTLNPPIRTAFISFASLSGPARGLGRLLRSEGSGQSE